MQVATEYQCSPSKDGPALPTPISRSDSKYRSQRVSEQKHTPGPWDVFGAQDASSDEWRALTVAEAAMPFTLVCFMPSDGTETITANARLIALAPDMFEALKRIANEDFVYASDDGEETQLSLRIADARAVIAKLSR